jgi:uncharacterized protein
MQIKQHPLVSNAIGTSRTLTSFHYGAENATQKVYIQAALHADESPGLLVAHHLRQRLAALEAEGVLTAEIVLVPVANPIGLAQWLDHSHIGRFELASAENFNRHYPDIAEAVIALVDGKLTNDEAQNTQTIRRAMHEALANLPSKNELTSLRKALYALAADADIVLDLHCDSEAEIHLYTGSPLWPKVEPLARYMGAGATLLETTSGDYPFDEACSRLWWILRERFPNHPIALACASITVELRGALDVSHDYAAQDADALLNYLAHQGMIAKAVPSLPALVADATPLAGSEALETPASGVIVFLREVGEVIRKGDAVVEIINPISGDVVTLRASTEGRLYARENRRFAHAGMRLCKIAGSVPFRTGKLLSA